MLLQIIFIWQNADFFYGNKKQILMTNIFLFCYNKEILHNTIECEHRDNEYNIK